MLVELLVESLDVPLAEEATSDAHDAAGDDQDAAVLVSGFLRAELERALLVRCVPPLFFWNGRAGWSWTYEEVRREPVGDGGDAVGDGDEGAALGAWACDVGGFPGDVNLGVALLVVSRVEYVCEMGEG